jgi:tetratricopeptide (TPR) repeat protein
MNRKEFLKTEIELNPSDPLNYYMLALEYKKEEDKALSTSYFDHLLESFHQYLPTYYTFGSYLIEIGEEDKAEQILTKGHSLALEAGQEKMAKEIKSLLDLYF